MITLNWPSNAQRNDFLDADINTIGRLVDFVYVESVSGCSACSLDPVTNTSTNSFCVVCSGEYWIENLAHYPASAHVTWKVMDQLGWVPGGIMFEGDCLVKVALSNSGIENIITATKSVVVDNRDMQIFKLDKRGSPEINRILISLKERGKDE